MLDSIQGQFLANSQVYPFIIVDDNLQIFKNMQSKLSAQICKNPLSIYKYMMDHKYRLNVVSIMKSFVSWFNNCFIIIYIEILNQAGDQQLKSLLKPNINDNG